MCRKEIENHLVKRKKIEDAINVVGRKVMLKGCKMRFFSMNKDTDGKKFLLQNFKI